MSTPKTNDVPVTENTIPFSIPGISKPIETWYKLFGDLSSPATPLIAIHGGPGLSHDYMLPMQELASLYNIPVILYDQIGNGKSTHLPEKNGDVAFWSDELFWDELENLITKLGLNERKGGYDILGHSWGGMIGAKWAGTRKRKGLRKLILSNAPATIALWDAAYESYRQFLPQEVQDALRRGEEAEAWESEEYDAAVTAFLQKFCVTVDPIPEDFIESFEWAKRDGTVIGTMMGPDGLRTLGPMKNWTAVEASKGVEVPTLVINGTNEGASDDAVKPFVDGIKGAKWIKFEDSTHLPFYEAKEKYFKIVGDWLSEK